FMLFLYQKTFIYQGMNCIFELSSFSYDQKYLSCTETDPVLEIEQIVYQENGIPVEYSRSRNRFDVRSYTYHDIK
ncbi:UTRA domain-containing protein, partial [Tetragenococcus halophilus]|uniref:UTRA domain-containing protein n=1 Tax=Tetragenococcus halophilus TaxID=51669 RepID=UPI0030F230AA